ncbi:transposase [Chloroflexus sp.]
MFIQGLSTKKVGDLVEPLSGNHPSPSTVSRIVHTLEEELTRSHLINP